jgi:hypothetical protein
VPGTQSTAAETHNHDALIFYNALITPFVAVLTERPVSPREPAHGTWAVLGLLSYLGVGCMSPLNFETNTGAAGLQTHFVLGA